MMRYVIGVDEAGRGPLAGPIAVGAVLVPHDYDLLGVFPGLNDSKQLPEGKRENLFQKLEEEAAEGKISYAVVFKSANDIDERGLSLPITEAIGELLTTLSPEPSGVHVYLDGLLSAPVAYAQETIPGGDAKIPAVMLASIAAKVSRDRLMMRIAAEHPVYGFEKHKGYGTKAHYEALRIHGPCTEHRRLFLRKFFAQA